MVVLFLGFKEISIPSSIVAVSFYIPTYSTRPFPFLNTSLAFSVCRLFDDGDSDWCEVISHCSFDLHFICWWSLRKAFLSLLAILWNSAFKWVNLSFSPLPFASLLFTAIYKACSDNHFDFLHFFFLGVVLIPASHTISRTSVHSSSGILSDLIPWVYFSLPLYNCKGFYLGQTWMV